MYNLCYVLKKNTYTESQKADAVQLFDDIYFFLYASDSSVFFIQISRIATCMCAMQYF